MILEGNTTRTDDASRDMAFSIRADGKMFGILSGNIYSDKMLAPIREVSCNAYDAHVRSGKKDEPIRVHLPERYGDCDFTVEDFGVGMDAEQVERNYISYGYSDKNSDNSLVGCFGLGCKSPFAYASRFSLRTRKAGVELNYEFYVDEGGIPRATKVSEKATDAPSGTKVTMPVRSGDVADFRSKAVRFYRTFLPHPIGNFELGDCPEFIAGIAASGSYGSGVLMGNVVYGFNPYDLGYEYEYRYSGVLVTAELGDIDISTSRESVQMTAKSKAFLSRILPERAAACESEWLERHKGFQNKLLLFCAWKKFLQNNTYVRTPKLSEAWSSYRVPYAGEGTVYHACKSRKDCIEGKPDSAGFPLPTVSDPEYFAVFYEEGDKLRVPWEIRQWCSRDSHRIAYVVNRQDVLMAFMADGFVPMTKEETGFVRPQRVRRARATHATGIDNLAGVYSPNLVERWVAIYGRDFVRPLNLESNALRESSAIYYLPVDSSKGIGYDTNQSLKLDANGRELWEYVCYGWKAIRYEEPAARFVLLTETARKRFEAAGAPIKELIPRLKAVFRKDNPAAAACIRYNSLQELNSQTKDFFGKRMNAEDFGSLTEEVRAIQETRGLDYRYLDAYEHVANRRRSRFQDEILAKCHELYPMLIPRDGDLENYMAERDRMRRLAKKTTAPVPEPVVA